MRRFIVISFVCVCFVSAVVSAQADCPAIVQTALETTHQVCDAIGRNQACYGNVNLTATPRDGIGDFAFSAPGDLADIGKVQTLQLSSMDESADSWGVALMKVQANLPDTLPGQNVTFVLFGDVQIENRGGDSAPKSVTLNVTAKNKVNIRSAPSTTSAIAGSLSGGQTLVVDGRTEAGDWLRVQLDGGGTGWVFANLVTVDGDTNTLAVVDPNSSASDTPPFGAMQAFYLKSGVGDAPCDKAPNSGILVQSPQGAARVTLEVNDVNIQLGSTVYIESCECHGMDLIVIEGGALVTAAGVTRYVPAGSQIHIPTGDDGNASGPPEDITSYAPEAVQALPISLLGDATITVAAPLTETEIAAAQDPIPQDGQWSYDLTLKGTGSSCQWDTNGTKTITHTNHQAFHLEDNGQTLVWDYVGVDGVTRTVTVSRTGPGTYSTFTNGMEHAINVFSPTHFVIETDQTGICHLTESYNLVQAD